MKPCWLRLWRVTVIMTGAAAIAMPGHAQQARTTETRQVPVQVRSNVDAPAEAQLAREWGLHAEEWSRYRQLMQGPLGILSPHLDPLTALGIEARSDAGRRRYAELQVQFEAQRVQKELTYQQAYDAAWARLYPHLQRVRLTGTNPPTVGRTDDSIAGRLAVFVKADCPACDTHVQQLQAAGAAFDLYMVGSQGDDARVRAWATHAGVDPAKVRAGTITLNHDGGRWLSIGGQGDLPAVVQEVHGSWQRR